MANKKRELFYSKHERILFYIAGYTDNSQNVWAFITMLLRHSFWVGWIGRKWVTKVNTDYIYSSRRYKYMRVFYVTTDVIPEGAFIINSERDPTCWTMWKWLHD